MLNSRGSTWVVGGLVCGGLLVIGWAVQTAAVFVLAEDEERPPIVVKGGSLIFESGDRKQGKPGKPWKKEMMVDTQGKGQVQWKPEHPNGIPSAILKVTFAGGTDEAGRRPCAATFLPEFDVVYDPDGGGPAAQPVTYQVTRRPRDTGRGTLAPAIVETGPPLRETKDPNFPGLMLAGSNKTAFRVDYVKADGKRGTCNQPTEVAVNSVR